MGEGEGTSSLSKEPRTPGRRQPSVERRGELRIMWLSSDGRWVPRRFLRANGRFECLRIREDTIAETRLRKCTQVWDRHSRPCAKVASWG